MSRRSPPTQRDMKRGTKLSVYVNREVDSDLALLRLRFRGVTDPALVRRALAALAAQTIPERRVVYGTEGHGTVWN
jgi:hypothetical protein